MNEHEDRPEGWFRKKFGPMLEPIGRFRWAFPLLMLAAGYLIPPLRITIGGTMTNGLLIALFVSLIIMVVWLVAEILMVTNRQTSTGELQRDDMFSLFLAVGLSIWGGWMLRDGVGWWFIIPYVGAVVDAFLSGYL